MFTKKLLSVKDNNLHHAYLIEGDPAQVSGEIISFIEDGGISCVGNPDVYQEFFETLTIENSRSLKEAGSIKSINGSKRFFVIGSYFFTREAQNSLLKLFEEPVANTHFFLITPNINLILPTIKSRMVILNSIGKVLPDTEILKIAEVFLKLSKDKRLLEIEKIIKKHKDKDEESSLKRDALNLINAIEYNIYTNDKIKDKNIKKEIFNEINKCRDYITDRGASTKMLLEHLAIILPLIK